MPEGVPSNHRARQERAEQTRAHIIEVAAAGFAAQGLDGISLNDVVKRSGLSKGAFYFHFSSKEELAFEVFQAKQQQLLDALARNDHTGPTSAADALAGALRRRNRLLAEDPSLACVTRLGNELNVRAEPGAVLASFHEPAIAMIAGLVRYGQDTGEFRPDLDPDGAARAVFAWIVGLDTLSMLSSGGKDLPERSEELLSILLPGLLARGRPASRPKRSKT